MSDPNASADRAASKEQQTGPVREPETEQLSPGGVRSDSGGRLPCLVGYDLLSELGRGGMGVVYKARQKSLDRIVALKMIRDGALAGNDQMARLRVEAVAAARLQHPNIVQVFDLCDHEGQPYYVMEYVPGGNLSQWLNGQPMPTRNAADLVETLARAVHHAHQQGIIHRDLKPANVLLASPVASAPGVASGGDATGLADVIPKISDFGLAKRLDAGASVTPSSAVLG